MLRWISLFLGLGLMTGCQDNNGDRTGPPAPSQANTALNLEARVTGQYVTGLRIADGNWPLTGPGELVELVILTEGMSGIGQFLLELELQPASFFDLSASRFDVEEPFVTLGSGVESIDESDNEFRIGGADLFRNTSGSAVLGTLRLATSDSADTETSATVRITLFSMGPDTKSRDNFDAEDLNMGVILNGE